MATTGKTEKTKAKRAVGITLNVVLWVFLVFALIMMIFAFASTSNQYGVSTLGNKVILNVESGSMEPTIRTGDMIVGKIISLDEKKALKAKDADYAGDIITFYADLDGNGTKEINTHRIVEVKIDGDSYSFRTQGDNTETNPNPDNYYVRADDIICIWKEGDTQIHGLGAVLGFFQSRVGFLIFVILPLVGLFAYEVVRLVMMIRNIKGKDKKDITEAEREEIRRLAIEEYKRSLAGEETAGKTDGVSVENQSDATE